MRTNGAKTSDRISGTIERGYEHLEPRLLLRLVAVAAKGLAALDRVGDVLGHVAQFGEFRPDCSVGAYAPRSARSSIRRK